MRADAYLHTLPKELLYVDFSGIIVTLIKLFALIVIGFVMSRKGILDSNVNKGMTSLLVNVTNPCLMLGSLASAGNIPQDTVLKVVIFGFAAYLLLPLVSYLIVRLARFPKDRRGVMQMLLVFSNTGFMAVPVMQALYGDVSVFYVNIMNIPFNFLCYTYGVYITAKDARLMAASQTGNEGPGPSDQPSASDKAPVLNWKVLLTPGLVSSLLALILYFCHISLPRPVSETFQYIGDITPPLSMLLIGSILGEFPLKCLVENPKVNVFLTLKMLIFPVVFMLAARMVFDDPMIIGITTLTFAMPCASMDIMLTKQYGGQTRIASAGVFYSTVLSLFTIPLVYLTLFRFF